MEPHNSLKSPNSSRTHVVYDYRHSNINKLLENAENVDWTLVMDPNDNVNEQWKRFQEQILALINTSLPQRTVRLSSKDKSWMTPLTKLLINDKWAAYRSKNWESYKRLKAKVREEITKAKSIWAEKIKKSPHGLWKAAKSLSGKINNQHSLASLIAQYGSQQHLAEEIANLMVGRDERVREVEDILKDDDWTVRFTDLEVLQQLRKLSPNKSPGVDRIPNKIYRLLAPTVARPLRVIFESSISQRCFPSEWKRAIVVPIPKTFPPTLNKIRTISLLPTPAKILEKLVLKHEYQRIEPLFGPHQHAFRKLASTTTALLTITDSLTKLYDNSTVTGFGVISLDFSKAFDYVDHGTLLEKVRCAHLPKGFAGWLQSYLSQRSFQVKIQGKFSSPHVVHTGVPQGSVLGPALFSILVGDLTCNSGNHLVQYADDANIILPFITKDPLKIKNVIQRQLKDVETWCAQNKQVLNVEKSKVMIFMRSSLEIECLPLPLSKNLKILGVTLSDDLKWDLHIAALCKKACQRLHILRVLKPHTTQDELHQVYIAIIRSIFDYCSQVFVHLPVKLTHKIRRIEKRAHRLIFGDEKKCDCLLDGLEQRREKLSLNLFTATLSNSHHPLYNMLPGALRHKSRLASFQCRTKRRKNSFFPYTTILYNKNK